MTNLTQSGEFSKAELPKITLENVISESRSIFRNLKTCTNVKESLTIERFLFRNFFYQAWECGYRLEKREEHDSSLYFRRVILQAVYSCDIHSVDEIEECLNFILSELDGDLDKNIQPLLDHLFEEVRAYYTSDYFDDENHDLGKLIVIYDQEVERFFNDIKPVLRCLSEKKWKRVN